MMSKPAAEVEETEEKVVDQASAARTIAELETEIATLTRTGGAGLTGAPQRDRHGNGMNCPTCCSRNRRRRRWTSCSTPADTAAS